jgi:hypothetical protein
MLRPLTSNAQDLPYARTGAFIGGGFTYAFENFDFDDFENNPGEDFDAKDAAGIDMRGGYRLLPNLALEGDFQFYDGIRLRLGLFEQHRRARLRLSPPTPRATRLPGASNLTGLFGIGVGVLAIDFAGDNFDDDDTTEADDSFLVRVGAGVDFYITPSVLVFVEASYNHQTSELDFGRGGGGIKEDLIPVTIGAQYYFGRRGKIGRVLDIHCDSLSAPDSAA